MAAASRTDWKGSYHQMCDSYKALVMEHDRLEETVRRMARDPEYAASVTSLGDFELDALIVLGVSPDSWTTP